jgi:hypothetical protein
MLTVKKLLLFMFGLINNFLSFFRFQLEYHPQSIEFKEKINNLLKMLRPESQMKELIRIGSDNDGGYLVPDDIEGIKYCYSPGVSDNSDFEDQLTTHGIKCFLADYSVDKPAKYNNLFRFTKKYLGNKNDAQTMRLESWINHNESDEEMLLQMDIEGAEYQVILDTPSETLRRFRILVIEFHGFKKLAQQHSFDLISTSFYKILRDFRIVHVHANNCCKAIKVGDQLIPPVMEFTFIRNDRFVKSDNKISIPHRLDSKNLPNNKEVYLPSLLR